MDPMQSTHNRPSRSVSSSQSDLHPRLAATVRRHLQSRWKKPPQRVDAPALAALDAALAAHTGPLVLDSFCGTGESTALLALRHPDALVVGVDKSAARLARHRGGRTAPQNYLLLRAHCEAVWRHLAEHARSASPALPAVSQPLAETRAPAAPRTRPPRVPAAASARRQPGTAQQLAAVPVEEFGVALHLAGHASRIGVVDGRHPLTPFERKYRASGQTLWCAAGAAVKRAPMRYPETTRKEITTHVAGSQ
jgi:tRNA (guanine-N7-)-methyltransferase